MEKESALGSGVPGLSEHQFLYFSMLLVHLIGRWKDSTVHEIIQIWSIYPHISNSLGYIYKSFFFFTPYQFSDEPDKKKNTQLFSFYYMSWTVLGEKQKYFFLPGKIYHTHSIFKDKRALYEILIIFSNMPPPPSPAYTDAASTSASSGTWSISVKSLWKLIHS